MRRIDRTINWLEGFVTEPVADMRDHWKAAKPASALGAPAGSLACRVARLDERARVLSVATLLSACVLGVVGGSIPFVGATVAYLVVGWLAATATIIALGWVELFAEWGRFGRKASDSAASSDPDAPLPAGSRRAARVRIVDAPGTDGGARAGSVRAPERVCGRGSEARGALVPAAGAAAAVRSAARSAARGDIR